MNTMFYKGYIGKVEYDDECHVFSGSVINTRKIITFQGESVTELENEFRTSIEEYLAWCLQENVQPEKPFSGKFNVRLKPEIHQKAVMKAKILGLSLNSFVEKAIEDKLSC